MRRFAVWTTKSDYYLLKFGDSECSSAELEMTYYDLAIAAGINMMPSKLYSVEGNNHFMTKRFDREDGDVKHHIQTFCALKHFDFNEVLSFSYEQLFQTMRELKLT